MESGKWKGKKRVPELRFPEFEGEWEERKLGETIKIYSGNSPSKVKFVDEGLMYLKVDDLNYTAKNITTSNLYITPEDIEFLPSNNIIFPKRGAAILTNKIRINKLPCYFDTNLMGVEISQEDIDLEYLYNLLMLKKLYRIADTSTIPQLNNKHLNELKLLFPSLSEQQKIGDFFYKIDKKLELQQQRIEALKEYKKGMMQKIFSQEIRFKDDNGKDYPEWRQLLVEKVLKSRGVKQYQILNNEILDKGKYPVVTQSKKIIEGYFNDSTKVYSETPVIVFGDHTTILKYIEFNFIVGGDGVKVLYANDRYNLKYIYYILSYKNVRQEGYKRHYTMLKELRITVPSLPEQTKIANFLSSLDKKIELEEEKLENFKQFKKGLMQKMFI